MGKMTASTPPPQVMFRFDYPTQQVQGIYVFQHCLGGGGRLGVGKGDLQTSRTHFLNPRRIASFSEFLRPLQLYYQPSICERLNRSDIKGNLHSWDKLTLHCLK